MNANLRPGHKEESCLVMINNFRKQIEKQLNDFLHKTVELQGGNEETAYKYYTKMLSIIDVSTMLDILTNEERDECYDKVHNFFSGLEVEIFEFSTLNEHHFEKMGYGVLDLVFIYKINIQERINENLKIYREYKRNEEQQCSRKDYIDACSNIVNFAENFKIITEKEVAETKEIINLHKKNKFNKQEIIFIPKNLYTQI